MVFYRSGEAPKPAGSLEQAGALASAAPTAHGTQAEQMLELQSQVGNQATLAMTGAGTRLPAQDIIKASFNGDTGGSTVDHSLAANNASMAYTQRTPIVLGPDAAPLE
ncbi:hypothetical protein [Cohnella boryungensis]|uniref:Uncharacterized protein n=1 Tax=Cohnella boryungensis TaxID=768479 RepID=A0ABV8S3P2_9BACL